MITIRHRGLVGVIYAGVILGAWTASSGADPKTIDEIINDVERNERLYDDFEVTLTQTFELVGPAKVHAAEDSVVSRTIAVKYIAQAPAFRIEAKGTSRTAKESTESSRIRVFDGKVTRLLDDGKLANIVDGRVEDHYTVRPHMLLRWGIDRRNVPMSIYLRGSSAISAAYPEQAVDSGLECLAVYGGQEDFKAHRCHRVSIIFGSRSIADASIRYEFWLVAERNYLPVRMKSFSRKTSKTIPIAEGVVEEFQELKPGVWFPILATTTLFDPETIRSSSTQVPTQIYKCFLSDASVEPKHGNVAFKELTIPDGAVVYHLDRDRKPVNGYIQGRPDTRGVKPVAGRGVSRIWIIVVLNTLVFGIVALFVVRNRRRANGGAKS